MVISKDKQRVKMNTKKVTWYEKTVEYAFARKFLEAAAMPLSGTAEKVGDTIFYEGNSFFIIEFKRGLDLNSEKRKEQNKYDGNVATSARKILAHEACVSHYVVWGYIDEEQKFGLKAQCYIDFIAEEYLEQYMEEYIERYNDARNDVRNDIRNYDFPKHIKQNYLFDYADRSLSNKIQPWELTSNHTGFYPIKDLEKLKTYLQLLIDEKESSSKDSSSVDYGNILIVDKDGNACALSDREGLQKLELKFPTNTPSSTYSPK